MELTQDGFLKKRDVDGTTVIHKICFMGNMVSLNLILNVIQIFPEEFIMEDHQNNQPLHYAVRSGNIEFVRLFIEHVSKLNDFKTKDDMCDFLSCYNTDSITPLYIAFKLKNIEMIKLLLEFGADIDEEMMNMTTPLHLACMFGNIEIFLYLIHNKAKITIDDNGQSPLHSACIGGNINIIRILLQHFLELNIAAELTSVSEFISLCDDNNISPLQIAFQQKNMQLIRLLLVEFGGNVNELMNDNNTPLHYACGWGNFDFFRFLINKKAKITLNELGQTPLHLACIGGNINIVKILLKRFSELDDEELLTQFINFYDTNYVCTLQIAFEKKNMPLIKLLLEFGADINEEMDEGNTALHYACEWGVFDFFMFIINKQALIKINDNGGTPLHSACIGGNIDIVKKLVSMGINKEYTNLDGQTARVLAVQNGHQAIFDYLQNKSQTNLFFVCEENDDDDDE